MEQPPHCPSNQCGNSSDCEYTERQHQDDHAQNVCAPRSGVGKEGCEHRGKNDPGERCDSYPTDHGLSLADYSCRVTERCADQPTGERCGCAGEHDKEKECRSVTPAQHGRQEPSRWYDASDGAKAHGRSHSGPATHERPGRSHLEPPVALPPLLQITSFDVRIWLF